MPIGSDRTGAAATAAFTELFQAHRTALYGYLLGRTGRPDTAEELTQDLFLRAWRHLPELIGRSTDGQRAWLFTVARNLAVDELRQRRTRDATLTAARAQPAGHAPPASATVVAADDVQRVGAAIAGLPDELRTVLSLATAGELTSAEIAALLGIPAGTVRYRLSRARAALAAVLIDGTAAPPHQPTTDSSARRETESKPRSVAVVSTGAATNPTRGTANRVHRTPRDAPPSRATGRTNRKDTH